MNNVTHSVNPLNGCQDVLELSKLLIIIACFDCDDCLETVVNPLPPSGELLSLNRYIQISVAAYFEAIHKLLRPEI